MSTSAYPARRTLKQSTLSFKRATGADQAETSSNKLALPTTKRSFSQAFEARSETHKEAENTASSPKSIAEPSTMTIKVIEETGDLFAAPSDSVLIHSCNGVGSWGGGIALAFKQRYPNAFKAYQSHCKSSSPSDLVGTALLIPPCEKSGPPHWVGCLFTSRQFGRRKDTPANIIQATKPAMEQLLEEIANEGKDKIGGIFMCKINSGLFNVPWEQSKAIIECLAVDLNGIPREIKVVSPPL